jgi:hypothetical protein
VQVHCALVALRLEDRIYKTVIRGLSPVAVALATAGCSHAPTLDLFGSYFPAWMLCAAAGILAAVVIRLILGLAGIHEYVLVPLLTYTSFAVAAALLVWLFWFGY